MSTDTALNETSWIPLWSALSVSYFKNICKIKESKTLTGFKGHLLMAFIGDMTYRRYACVQLNRKQREKNRLLTVDLLLLSLTQVRAY